MLRALAAAGHSLPALSLPLHLRCTLPLIAIVSRSPPAAAPQPKASVFDRMAAKPQGKADCAAPPPAARCSLKPALSDSRFPSDVSAVSPLSVLWWLLPAGGTSTTTFTWACVRAAHPLVFSTLSIAPYTRVQTLRSASVVRRRTAPSPRQLVHPDLSTQVHPNGGGGGSF